ncbi:hypothetical protein ACOSQ4_002923 [Xanthoceras sorbifolium]
MPTVGSKYHATKVESASSSYRRTSGQSTTTENVVDISVSASEDTEGEEDKDYNPVPGGWISEELDDSETFDNAVEDKVPEDTESEEDILLDATSFDWDNDFIPADAIDSDSDGENGRPEKARRRVPFRADPTGKIKLEVAQLFQNLHHFKQVIRDFAVQEGFQLRRIKNERDRYTAECAY